MPDVVTEEEEAPVGAPGRRRLGATLRLLTSPGDPGQERYRRIALATLTRWLARLCNVAVNLISVPLAARLLGPERYGVWIVASSLIGWIILGEVGLGSQLTSLLAESSGVGDRDRARRYTAATFWVQVGVSLSAALALALAWPFLAWDRLFNVSSPLARSESPGVAALVLVTALVSLPVSLTGRIYAGYQEGWKANFWSIAASLATLAALLAAAFRRPGLLGLAVALAVTPMAVQVLNLTWLFVWEKPWLFGGPREVDRRTVGRVMRGSLWMFLFDAQAIVWLSKDSLLITRLLGPAQVGPYNVTYRIDFLLMGVLVNGVTWSMWPAYVEAMVRGDWDWIDRAYARSRRYLLCLYGGVVLAVSLVMLPLVKVWAGESLVPPPALPWLLAALFFLMAVSSVDSYLIIAAGKVRTVAVCGLLGAATSVILAVPMARWWGVTGVAAANVIACAAFMIVPLQVASREILAERRPIGTAHGSSDPS